MAVKGSAFLNLFLSTIFLSVFTASRFPLGYGIIALSASVALSFLQYYHYPVGLARRAGEWVSIGSISYIYHLTT